MMQLMVLYIVSIVIVGGSYGLMPYMTPDTVQFGVRVPPAHVNAASIAKVRKAYYTLWMIIMGLMIVVSVVLQVIGAGTGATSALVALIVLGVTLVLNYLNYFFARRRLLTAKEDEHWYEGVTESLMADTSAHRKTDHPSLLWGLPAAVVAIVSILIPAIRYGQLPERMAVHFNAAGVADGFAAKSFWSVFGPCITSVVLLVVIVIVHLSLHRFAVRLDPSNPGASKHRYTVLLREGTKAVWVMLAIINVGTTLTLLPLWGISQSVTTMAGIGTVFVMLGVVVGIVWIARAAKQTRRIAEGAAASGVVARDDDRFWVAGAFYFNRHDSAMFVPKRFGIGMTVNMGNPIAWLVLLIIIAIPVVISLLAGR